MKKIRLLLVTLVTVLSSTNLFAAMNTATAWWNNETFESYTAGTSFKVAGTPAGIPFTGWAQNGGNRDPYVSAQTVTGTNGGGATGIVFGISKNITTMTAGTGSETSGAIKTFTNALKEYVYVKTAYLTSLGTTSYTFRNNAGATVFQLLGADATSNSLSCTGVTTAQVAMGVRAAWAHAEFLLDLKTGKATKIIITYNSVSKTFTNITLPASGEIKTLALSLGRYYYGGLDNTTVAAVAPDSIKDITGVSSLQTAPTVTNTDISVTGFARLMDTYCALDTTTADITWSISDYGTLSPADQALVSLTRKENNTRFATLAAGNISANGTITLSAVFGGVTLNKTVDLMAASTDGFKTLISTQITNGNAAMAAVTDVNPYITGAKSTLSAAIVSAQAMVDSTSATMEAVQAELALIQAANTAFTDAMTPYNSFVTYIGTATTTHDAEVRTAAFYTTVKATLNTAIGTATAARSTIATGTDITTAMTAIQGAVTQFNTDIPAYANLQTQITSVTTRLTAVAPRTGDTRFLMFPTATVATLTAAKTTADGVLTSATTASELTTAQSTLATALTTFNAAPRVANNPTQYYRIYSWGADNGDGGTTKYSLIATSGGQLKYVTSTSDSIFNNGSNAKWIITEGTTGRFTIQNKETGTYISGSSLSATPMDLSLPENTSQTGLIKAASDSYFIYSIVNIANGRGLELDLWDAVSATGTLTSAGAPANRFRYAFQFEPVSSWTGTGAWSTASNWEDNTVPPAGSNVTIVSGSVAIDQDVAVSSIVANPGVDVTLNSGKTLTISDYLTLKSNAANGTATFVDNGTTTVAGTTKVEQYITGAGDATPNGRGWYVSSPVATATSNVYAAAGTNQLWSYSEAANGYTEIVNNTDTMAPMRGYYAKIGANTVVTYIGGSLNNGEIKNENLTRTGDVNAKRGYHLMGNPYPSMLDWNATLKTNMLTTMWYRTQNTGNTMVFDSYNTTGSVGTNNNGNGNVNQFIAPMQAFWVKVDADGNTGSITFNNSMRSHQTGRFLRQADGSAQQVLRLQVSNGINSDEALVVFNANASDGVDAFDAPKMSNENAAIPEIYTMIGSEKMVINGMNNYEPAKELALGFKTGVTNTFTIKTLEAINFGTDTKIILKDKLLATQQELAAGSTYSFTSDSINTVDRFSVSITKTVTGIQQATSLENLSVIRNTAGQVVVRISGNRSTEGTITIFSALGQKIKTARTTGQNTVLDADLTGGIYLVSVNIAGQKATKKLVIN